jgi:fatty acid desaturase
MRFLSVSLCLIAATSWSCHGFSPAASNKMVMKAGTGIPTRVKQLFKSASAKAGVSSRVSAPLKAVAVQDTDFSRVAEDDVDESTDTQSNENVEKALRAGTIMKMLPKESFQVDTKTSLTYFGIDAAAVICSMSFLYAVVTSDLYSTAPLYMQAAMTAPLQIITGFAMWCNWCIGHDAGHSLISKKHQWLNDVVGEVSHSMLALTPFVPWQLSHRRHHLNHNHLTKDYSHQWFIRGNGDSREAPVPEVPAEDMVWWMKLSYQTRNIQLPILYLVYLLVGVPDGGHVFLYGKLWEGIDLKTKLRAYGSVAVSMLTATSLWAAMGTANFAVVCFAPWLVMSFWLFAVTYLQVRTCTPHTLFLQKNRCLCVGFTHSHILLSTYVSFN